MKFILSLLLFFSGSTSVFSQVLVLPQECDKEFQDCEDLSGQKSVTVAKISTDNEGNLVDELGELVVGKRYGAVTVHETKNGTTTVSCDGGCRFTRGFFATKVCDRDNVCIEVGGTIVEKMNADQRK